MDDFETKDAVATNGLAEAEKTESGIHIIKEADCQVEHVKKEITGINWVFPFMSCQNGITDGTSCECAIKAPAFSEEDGCYLKDADPKVLPKLCPEYKQK